MASFREALSASFFSVSFAFCSLSPMEVKSANVSAIFPPYSPARQELHRHATTAHYFPFGRGTEDDFLYTSKKKMTNMRIGQWDTAGADCTGQSRMRSRLLRAREPISSCVDISKGWATGIRDVASDWHLSNYKHEIRTIISSYSNKIIFYISSTFTLHFFENSSSTICAALQRSVRSLWSILLTLA